MTKKNFLAITANTFEWYEYVIIAFLSKFISSYFFALDNEKESVLLTFSVLAIGYLARPAGALFFGCLSDKKGTPYVLTVVMITMAIPNLLIVLLPSCESIGLSSSIFLILARMVQGFACGAELPLMAVYLYKTSERSRLVCALVNASSLLGVLLASMVMVVMSSLFTDQEMIEGAWRYPVLLGMPMMVSLFILRQRMFSSESDIKPCGETIKKKPGVKPYLDGIAIVSILQVTFYGLYIWFADYLKLYFYVDDHTCTVIRFLSLLWLSVIVVASSRYLEKIGIGSILKALPVLGGLIFLLFYIISIDPAIEVILLGMVIISVPVGILDAIVLSILNELFEEGGRGLGVSLTFTLASVFVGSTTPIVSMKLIDATGMTMMPVYLILSVYALACLVISSKWPQE